MPQSTFIERKVIAQTFVSGHLVSTVRCERFETKVFPSDGTMEGTDLTDAIDEYAYDTYKDALIGHAEVMARYLSNQEPYNTGTGE